MKTHTLLRAKSGLRWIVALSLGLSPMHLHAANTAPDLDGDGVPNIVDPDIDNDGIPNALDDNIDGGIAKSGPYSGQYLGDHINNDNPGEKDIDGDDQADDSLGETDLDGDGKTDNDALEQDIDGDRRADNSPGELDEDGDGRMDDAASEDDIDGDSLDDDDIVELDIDGDNSLDTVDSDIDGDDKSNSAVDEHDIDGDGKLNADADEDDTDGDGARNREDGDDDNDGLDDEDDDDHHDEDDEVKVHTDLSPTNAALNHSDARVTIQRMATGTVELKVSAGDFDPGTYNIVIGGTVRGTLVLSGSSGNASGERKFKSTSRTTTGEFLPLNFDVINQPIRIELGSVVYYTGTIPTPPAALPGGGPVEPPVTSVLTQPLTAGSTTPPQANAKVVVDIGLVGVIEIEIEAESLAAGTYTVSIGGVERGTLIMALDQGTVKGHRHFEIIPDEPDELLLDFPVVGQPLVISQGGTTYFSGIVPGGE